MARPEAAALAIALLAGCHLVDQRDFNPHAGAKPTLPTPPAPPPFAPPPALVTIAFTTPNPPYQAALIEAVHRALERRPDAIFTVEIHVPVAGTPEDQVSAARAATGTARDVAQTIVDAGADQGQVETAIRVDPALKVKTALVGVH